MSPSLSPSELGKRSARARREKAARAAATGSRPSAPSPSPGAESQADRDAAAFTQARHVPLPPDTLAPAPLPPEPTDEERRNAARAVYLIHQLIACIPGFRAFALAHDSTYLTMSATPAALVIRKRFPLMSEPEAQLCTALGGHWLNAGYATIADLNKPRGARPTVVPFRRPGAPPAAAAPKPDAGAGAGAGPGTSGPANHPSPDGQARAPEHLEAPPSTERLPGSYEGALPGDKRDGEDESNQTVIGGPLALPDS